MKKLITFKDIDNARKVLDLLETASIEQIKGNYRELIVKYHPDKHQSSKNRAEYEEKIKEINNSYRIIMNYCTNYPISLENIMKII